MATQQQSVDAESLFEKFQVYFDQKFDSVRSQNKDDYASLQEIKNKLEAQALIRPGNSQYEFCGKLQILLNKVKVSLLTKSDIAKTIEHIQEAEELLTDRKQKIKIADSSKAGWITVSHLEKGADTNQSPQRQKRVLAAEEAALKDLESRKRQKRAQNDSSGRV